MKDNTKNQKNKSLSTSESTGGQGVSKITLINPNETLVKKEDRSVVVRNSSGKLVRRTAKQESLDAIYDLIQENEIFVREEPTRIVVRNTAGKLVARKIETTILDNSSVVKQKELEVKPVMKKPEPVAEIKEEKSEDKAGLKERLMAKHAFLGRMERGEKVGVVSQPSAPLTPSATIQSDLVEEIEDEEDEIMPDADVLALEDAVNEDKFNRSIGRSSSKGRRAGDTGTYISGSAKNPNEKPDLKGTATAEGLVGNYSLAKPEKVVESEQKPVKVKKKRKPVKPWIIAVAFVSIYLAIMLTYFFVGYNFGDKSVNIILYYINIGEDAKLAYYDGEKFNSNDMLLTYYYSNEKIEEFRIDEGNLAEPTVGMGYALNKGYISGLWVDAFKDSSQRSVKIKFTFDNLICYVPITIYRNELTELKIEFSLKSVSAGTEIVPTIFGLYSNEILEEKGETIKKLLSLDQYDLYLGYNGQRVSLKELGCFDGSKYVLPETIGGETIDYSLTGTYIDAEVKSDGFSASKYIEIYRVI